MKEDNNKHAILILAHNKLKQLATLLSCVDSENTDIFLHFDQKTHLPEEDIVFLKNSVDKSRLFFTDRIPVSWGGFSLVRAELILLKNALDHGSYRYYHLISGLDMPLKPIKEIITFYQSQDEIEYIAMEETKNIDQAWWKDRIKYYYPFQEKHCSFSFIDKTIRKSGLMIQKIMHVNRLNPKIRYGIGSQWFSITNTFAKYVLSQEQFIIRNFANGYCVDEVFLQTVYLNWQNKNKRNISQREAHPYISQTNFDAMRAIDWVRGTPYCFTKEDYSMLLETGLCWARKFDQDLDREIINQLAENAGGKSYL